MKRGISPSSGRSSGRNGARQEQDSGEGQDGAPTSNEASKKSGAAAGDAITAEGGNGEAAAAAAAAQGERTNYLVGMAGHRTLTSYIQDLSKGRRWTDRVRGWGEEAGLAEPSVKLALGFLDILGVSRASVYKQLLEDSLRVLLDQIPHLPENVLLDLLTDSFKFATHADLKSVPLKIISSLSAVPERVPEQFEELGLPLAIKHLAWEKDSVLFVRIVSPHADKYLASEFSPKMVLSSQQLRFYRSLDTIKRRKLMGPDRINALAEYTGDRPILIGEMFEAWNSQQKTVAVLGHRKWDEQTASDIEEKIIG
ncbi:unnamed protein product [Ectocarpus sp. CCAP 1310/34]|nr:unnamed protein product [Ectocarpus sp. CCAP 1310/34]